MAPTSTKIYFSWRENAFERLGLLGCTVFEYFTFGKLVSWEKVFRGGNFPVFFPGAVFSVVILSKTVRKFFLSVRRELELRMIVDA